jgi:methylthioribose-1-phosphate isomerase
MSHDRPLWWEDDALWLIDQTALPLVVKARRCATWEDVREAIRTLQIRGAPAIGLAAAYGLSLAVRAHRGERLEDQLRRLRHAASGLRAARPTAVNLVWAIDRQIATAAAATDSADLAARLLDTAHAMARADVLANRSIGHHGAALLPDRARVLTHCNTGMLATGGYGTAFGVLRSAYEQGRGIHVIVCEARPVLQGARLTAWELLQLGIPGTLITDGAAGTLMRAGEVDAVVVGADRIAANGDVANKIGTYSLAVLAGAHRIPFYVAAPLSTIDLSIEDGGQIPIEERPADEVAMIAGVRVAPPGIAVRNPAFDVTPHALVSAIITEAGVIRPPYLQNIRPTAAASPAGAAP